jgi:hypothetical protein
MIIKIIAKNFPVEEADWHNTDLQYYNKSIDGRIETTFLTGNSHYDRQRQKDEPVVGRWYLPDHGELDGCNEDQLIVDVER